VHTGEELQRHGEVAHFAFLPDGSSFVRGWNDPQSPFKPDAMRHPTTSKGGRFLITQYWSSSEPENWLDRLKESLSGNPPTVAGRQYVYVSWDTCKLMPRGLALELSADEAIAACIGPTGHIEVWDLPPRRPIFPLLALAALPALLFTAVIWWRLGRG